VPASGSVTTGKNWVFTGNVTVQGTFTSAAESATSEVITVASSNALAVGPAGTTNPSFNVDTSTASAATGLNVKSAAAAGGLALTVTSSGTNESLTIDAKGSGSISLNSAVASTGAVAIGSRLSITSNSAAAINVGPNGLTNPVLKVDASASNAATGLLIAGAAAGSGVAVTTQSSGTDESLTIEAKGAGTITFNPAVVAAAGGKVSSGIRFGSLNVGYYTGTGAPTFSAMNGSVYTDSNATTTTTRIYVNKSGAGTAGTTWTNLTTAA
jgi:hypothetical protein